MNLFRQCLCKKNIYALVISGHPSIEELQTAWQTIRIQYADAIKDHDYVAFAKLSREIEQLKIFQDQVRIAVNELQDRYTVQFHEALNKLLNYKFILDVYKPDEYDAELRKAVNRSKGELIDLHLKQMVLDSMFNKMATDGSFEPTDEFFENQLISLSDHAGYKLRSEDMMTFEYCERIRRVKLYSESLKKKS